MRREPASAPLKVRTIVTSTNDRACRITVKKSASIESLTSSIQCASSTTGGSARCVPAVGRLINAGKSRRRLHRDRWRGPRRRGRGSREDRRTAAVLWVGLSSLSLQPFPHGSSSRIGRPDGRPQTAGHGMERNVACVGLAERPEDIDSTLGLWRSPRPHVRSGSSRSPPGPSVRRRRHRFQSTALSRMPSTAAISQLAADGARNRHEPTIAAPHCHAQKAACGNGIVRRL